MFDEIMILEVIWLKDKVAFNQSSPYYTIPQSYYFAKIL